MMVPPSRSLESRCTLTAALPVPCTCWIGSPSPSVTSRNPGRRMTAVRYSSSTGPSVVCMERYTNRTSPCTSSRHAPMYARDNLVREYHPTRPGMGPLLAWRRPSLHMVQAQPREAAPLREASVKGALMLMRRERDSRA